MRPRVLREDFKLDECLEWDKCGDLRVVVGFYYWISANTAWISAKVAWISAKIPIYQPKPHHSIHKKRPPNLG
ncbi:MULTISPECIES: hypothetical protein [Bacillaceae]|uniref:hypothetical protein n=1 Tax=Bacillaceae TaxID=186817 RepID=UPI001F1D8947|nr:MULTISPECIES: hypothetical protein [Bacillaceae]MCF2649759.1 hypothetical protein [Niallia circulans]